MSPATQLLDTRDKSKVSTQSTISCGLQFTDLERSGTNFPFALLWRWETGMTHKLKGSLSGTTTTFAGNRPSNGTLKARDLDNEEDAPEPSAKDQRSGLSPI
ncbi:hypothetical protein Dda_1080 [Drechslerella dactyloides]|uniref:Uncharacterized protein n=1 Tax=Drechslerella dactyloides TaxID=74499 RepID=A0AAD6J8I7_DREDA|nr:hypothetical protein Dda_1080 [Drechslerella dactyloides]